MKRNYLIIVLIVLNVWLCIILLINKKSVNLNNSLNTSILDDYCKEEILQGMFNMLKYNKWIHNISDSAKLIFNNVFEQDDTYKLFYRIDFPYCGNCIFPVIEKLSKLKQSKKDKIILLSAFPEGHLNDEFNDVIKISNLKVINIQELDFYFETKGFVGPYLFIMDVNLKQEYLFFINQCNQYIINEYLALIEDKY